jgi:hypothetical protein
MQFAILGSPGRDLRDGEIDGSGRPRDGRWRSLITTADHCRHGGRPIGAVEPHVVSPAGPGARWERSDCMITRELHDHGWWGFWDTSLDLPGIVRPL